MKVFLKLLFITVFLTSCSTEGLEIDNYEMTEKELSRTVAVLEFNLSKGLNEKIVIETNELIKIDGDYFFAFKIKGLRHHIAFKSQPK